MKTGKKPFIILSIIILSAIMACNSGGEKFSFNVKGKLTNADNEWVILYKLTPRSAVKLDSSQMDDEGRFSITVKTSDTPELFLLKVKNYPERITLLMSNGETVNITGDALYINKTWKSEGSHGTKLLQALTSKINKAMDQADSIYFAFRATAKDTVNLKQRAAHTDSLLMNNYKNTYEFVKRFCLDNSDNLAGIIGLYTKYGTEHILDFNTDFDIFKTVAENTKKAMPDNVHVKALNESVEKHLAVINHKNEIEKTLEAGNKAPDFILTTPEGKRVELSLFKGSYVALYFWNSTKKECWDNNEKIKALYESNKDAFTPVWVSTEKDKLAWVNTIAMNRIQEFTNLLADETVYEAYNLEDKPRLFFIDTGGVILAKDISADSLKTLVESTINH